MSTFQEGNLGNTLFFVVPFYTKEANSYTRNLTPPLEGVTIANESMFMNS
jgi:hypothetical protein